MEVHLRDEPDKASKSRIKRLLDLAHSQFRLRLEDYRIFHDIAGNDVVVIAILPKSKARDWLDEFGTKEL